MSRKILKFEQILFDRLMTFIRRMTFLIESNHVTRNHFMSKTLIGFKI